MLITGTQGCKIKLYYVISFYGFLKIPQKFIEIYKNVDNCTKYIMLILWLFSKKAFKYLHFKFMHNVPICIRSGVILIIQ